jgi:hypothetical protein
MKLTKEEYLKKVLNKRTFRAFRKEIIKTLLKN